MGVLNEKYGYERINKPELVFRRSVRARIVAEAVKRHLKRKENLWILDLGAAEGLTLVELDALLPNNSFLGVEYSRRLIQCAQGLPNNVKVVEGNVMRLDRNVKARTYDVVSALAVMEHLENPVDAVREAARCLATGGLFIGTCPSPFWDRLSGAFGLVDGEQHEVQMNREKLVQIMEQGGLKVISYARFMWAPIAFLPYLKLRVSPGLSLNIDRCVGRIRIFDWLFVNQAIIARKCSQAGMCLS